MVLYVTKEDLDMRASLGFVKDYYKEEPDNSTTPPADYNLLLEMFENDTVLSTAIDTTVDVGSSNGFHFEGKNKKAVKTLQDVFENDLDFDIVVQNIFYSMLIYGDAFLEIRWKDGKPNELHVLETTEMKIRYDEHGEILGYVQVPSGAGSNALSGVQQQNAAGKKIYFSPDEIVHFKLKSIGSRVYSYSPFKPIMREFTTKKYASSYLSRIFANFPPRLMYVLKTANKEQTKAFIENLKRAKNSPHKDLVGVGDVDVKETGVFDFSQGLTDILNHLRTEMLMITKVPPIWVGIPDNSNRSNSEAQVRSFETRVKSIQNKIASAINKQLIPALGYSRKSVKFMFNPFSLMEEEKIVKICTGLKEIGLDDDSILDYLRKKGIHLRPEAKIKSEQEELKEKTSFGIDESNRNRGADSGSGRKTVLDGNGSSSAGKEKLESKQLRTDLWEYEVSVE